MDLVLVMGIGETLEVVVVPYYTIMQDLEPMVNTEDILHILERTLSIIAVILMEHKTHGVIIK
jgi:hypothetical protein